MKPKHRTWLAVGLFVPLAAILLTTFACLPVPLGDPEKAKMDDKLAGAFQGIPKAGEDKDRVPIVILRPWDARTYYLTWIEIDKKDGKDDPKVSHFKGWLTDVGGATFFVAQPLEADEPSQYITGDTAAKYWATFRLEKTRDGVDLKMIDPDSPILKTLVAGVKDGKTKTADIEAAIKAHVDDKTLYTDEPASFRKLGPGDQSFLEDTLKRANVSAGM